MKKTVRYSAVRFLRWFGLRHILRFLNKNIRRLSRATHFMQFAVEWGAPPYPEWFDHFLDVNYVWFHLKNPQMWERGIFNLLAIENGARVLELCCGDGFNAQYFYSIRAREVQSVDFDPDAINYAKSNHRSDNVGYQTGDIRESLPPGPFDNILWDAAIEHFSEAEMQRIFTNIKDRLSERGILSGHTIVERQDGKSHHEHEYEFKSKEDLIRILRPYFKKIKVFETIYPQRHNLYFYASDGDLPFDPDWKHLLSV